MNSPAEESRHTHICHARYAEHLMGPVRRLMNHPMSILPPLVAAGDTAVDVGCGPGFFTLPLAELVGPTGHVIAVDVQQDMLDMLGARMQASGLSSHIQLHLAANDTLGLTATADFVLAFWMLHETPDKRKLLTEAYALLKPGGRMLLVEPWGHVSKASFAAALAMAREIGYVLDGQPRVGFSRAAVLRRA